MRTLHIRATVGYVRQHLDYWKDDHALGDMSADEARKQLDDMQARGMKYVPSCDNVDDEGACIGHD